MKIVDKSQYRTTAPQRILYKDLACGDIYSMDLGEPLADKTLARMKIQGALDDVYVDGDDICPCPGESEPVVLLEGEFHVTLVRDTK